MKKLSRPPLSPSRLVIALSLAQISFPSPLLAAEVGERGDPHHDHALRVAMSKNNFCREHFFVPDGKTVPIYDIKNDIRFRAAAIHKEQLVKHQIGLPPVTPTASPIKAEKSSPSLLGTIASIPGHILYSPVYLAQGAYSLFPSWRSNPDASSAATAASSSGTGTSPSAGLVDDDADFVEVKDQAKAKRTPQSAASLLPLNGLTVTPVPDPVISILTNDGEQQDSGARAVTSPSLPVTLIHPGEEGSLSRAVLTTYAESGPQNLTVKGTSSSSRRPTLIYSGDGGGGRGLIPAILMAYFEKQTNTPMSDVFHYVIGSSISGIEVLGWTINNIDGRPCMTGAGSVDLFEKNFDAVFPKTSSWNLPARVWGALSSLKYTQYDPKPLEGLLQQYLGQATLSKARTNVFVTAIASDQNIPLILSNLTHPEALAWEAGRGGSAAPLYLSAYRATSLPGQPYLLDGGFWENNPADTILDRARAIEKAENSGYFDPVVLSLGTGIAPITPIPYDAGILNGVGPLIEASLQAQVSGTHLTLQAVLKENVNYFRVNPTLPYSIPLDILTPEYIATLRTAAESGFDTIDKFIQTDAVRLRLEAK